MAIVSDFGTSLLDFVYVQLGGTANSFPCVRKLAVCEPHDVCCDYLAVYVESVGDSTVIQGCDATFRTSVQYSVKLMRPCSTESPCNPAEPDTAAVLASLQDAETLRSALIRFTSFNTSGEYTFVIGPTVPVCSVSEQCSGWATSVVVNMNICVPQFTGAIVLPGRCDPCDPVPVLTAPEITKVFEKYS